MKLFSPRNIVILITLLNLSWVLFTGWSSDDLMYQTEKTRTRYQKIGFIGYYANNQIQIAKSIGRIAPLNTSQIIPYFMDNIYLYKIFMILFTTINVVLMYFLIKELSNSVETSIVSVLFLQLSFQFRLYHESLVSLYGVAQTIVFLVLGMFFYITKYLKYKNKLSYFLSLFFFFLLLLTYEIGILFIIPIIISLLLNKNDYLNNIKKIFPFIIVGTTYLFVYFYNRYINSGSMNYSGAVLSHDFYKFIKLYVNQLISTLPLSYSFSRDGALLKLNSLNINNKLLIISAFISLIYGLLLHKYIAKNNFFKDHLKQTYLVIFSLSMILFPSLLTSMSVKYQNDMSRVGFGFGYFFVYIQYFGIAIALATIYKYLGKMKLLIAFFLSIVFFFNFTNNVIVVNQGQVELYNHDKLLKNFIHLQKNSLQLNNGDNLVIIDKNDPRIPVTEFSIWINAYPWKNNFYIYRYLGKLVNIIQPENLVENFTKVPSNQVYKIIEIYNSRQETNSYVRFGTIINVDSNTLEYITSDGGVYQTKIF